MLDQIIKNTAKILDYEYIYHSSLQIIDICDWVTCDFVCPWHMGTNDHISLGFKIITHWDLTKMADDEWSLPKSINVYMSPHFNQVDQVGLRVYGATR